MKLWTWEQGRIQFTTYFRFTLWYFRVGKWGFDAYLLKYPKADILPYHIDEVKGGKHYRMNIRLKGEAKFFLAGKVIHKRIICFRPDKYIHSLWINSPTLKLSFGFVKFK